MTCKISYMYERWTAYWWAVNNIDFTFFHLIFFLIVSLHPLLACSTSMRWNDVWEMRRKMNVDIVSNKRLLILPLPQYNYYYITDYVIVNGNHI